MIKVTVMYPNNDGHQFDAKSHIPLVKSKLEAALKRVEVARVWPAERPDRSRPSFSCFT